MECDASKLGIGVVLMQNGQPVAFESRTLTNAKNNLSMYDKEMLVIIHVLDKFKQYLVIRPFVIWSDHNILNYFLNHTNLIEK